MTWRSMLFTDKPLVIPCLVKNSNGDDVVEAVEYDAFIKGGYRIDSSRYYSGMAESGHRIRDWDTEFDHCFSGNPKKMPGYEYQFGFGPYDHIISKKLSDYGENLKSNAIHQEFLRYQIEQRDTLMYMMPCLYIDHVITDEDFDNAVDFRLSDYCFEFG